MSALGFMLAGFGLFTCWSALTQQNVFDVLRAIVGAPVPTRDKTGKATTQAASSGTGQARSGTVSA